MIRTDRQGSHAHYHYSLLTRKFFVCSFVLTRGSTFVRTTISFVVANRVANVWYVDLAIIKNLLLTGFSLFSKELTKLAEKIFVLHNAIFYQRGLPFPTCTYHKRGYEK